MEEVLEKEDQSEREVEWAAEMDVQGTNFEDHDPRGPMTVRRRMIMRRTCFGTFNAAKVVKRVAGRVWLLD